MVRIQFVEGDIVRIKDTQRKYYTSCYKNEVSFMIAQNNDNGIIRLDTIEEDVPCMDIEPIPINGKDDINIYYDPFIAASGLDAKCTSKDETYYLDQFKQMPTDDEGKTLYDLCMNQKFHFVHEVQHWLCETHRWDGLYINHRL